MNAYIAEALQEIECIHRFAGLTLREGAVSGASVAFRFRASPRIKTAGMLHEFIKTKNPTNGNSI